MKTLEIKISKMWSITDMGLWISLVAVVVLMLFLLSSVFAEQQQVIESTGQQEYSVPEDKKQEWENIKNHVLDEYKVCEEHCGNDSDCMNRCERVYRHRLETEHKKLTYE